MANHKTAERWGGYQLNLKVVSTAWKTSIHGAKWASQGREFHGRRAVPEKALHPMSTRLNLTYWWDTEKGSPCGMTGTWKMVLLGRDSFTSMSFTLELWYLLTSLLFLLLASTQRFPGRNGLDRVKPGRHSTKVMGNQYSTDERKLFTQCAINVWNSLPQVMVLVTGLDGFKGETETFMENKLINDC